MDKEQIQNRVTEINKQLGAVSKLIFASGYYNIKKYRIRDVKYMKKHEIKRLLNCQGARMRIYNKKVEKLRWWIRQLLRENRMLWEEKLRFK